MIFVSFIIYILPFFIPITNAQLFLRDIPIVHFVVRPFGEILLWQIRKTKSKS